MAIWVLTRRTILFRDRKVSLVGPVILGVLLILSSKCPSSRKRPNRQTTQRIINGLPYTCCPFDLKWQQLLHEYFNCMSTFRITCWMSNIPGIVEGKESRITHQRYKARFAVWIAQESTSEHLYALVSSGIFSLHLLRMCLVIHPSEIACHSIGVLFICPEPQLPTAFSLLPPPDGNTKPPGDAFPSPVTSSFPEGLPSERDCLWPCPAHFEAQYQRSDSSGVRPILCIFPLRMGLSLSVGAVMWFLPRPGIPSHFLLYHTLFPWFFALTQVLDLSLLLSVVFCLLIYENQSV